MMRSPEDRFAVAEAYFAGFGETLPRQWKPLQDLLRWMRAQRLESDVYVSAGLSGLWISDRPADPSGSHVLNVVPRGEYLHFEYTRTKGASDGMSKTVPVPEAPECLRQFLVHKFGIYRQAEKMGEPGAPGQRP